jgi:hypothetical protein
MKITPDKLRVAWYEDADGQYVGVPDFSTDDAPTAPERAAYMVYRNPLELVVQRYAVAQDGQPELIGIGNATFSEDLALALSYASNGLSLGTAILVAASACERCTNALAYSHNLAWGYPECGEEWNAADTQCTFCEDVSCE